MVLTGRSVALERGLFVSSDNNYLCVKFDGGHSIYADQLAFAVLNNFLTTDK